jgi:hypothetical protein
MYLLGEIDRIDWSVRELNFIPFWAINDHWTTLKDCTERKTETICVQKESLPGNRQPLNHDYGMPAASKRNIVPMGVRIRSYRRDDKVIASDINQRSMKFNCPMMRWVCYRAQLTIRQGGRSKSVHD